MTEDEAKTKWCPFARNYHPTASSFNRQNTGEAAGMSGRASSPCVGSACMAWRWTNAKMGHDRNYQVITHGAAEGARRWEAYCRENPLLGACGLAVAPK